MAGGTAPPSTSNSSVPKQGEGALLAPGKMPAANGPVDRIKAGEYLTINQNLTSKNGEYTLTFQDNLSFCIQNKKGEKTYYYNRVGVTGAKFLTVTDGGELRILARGGTILWTSTASLFNDSGDDDEVYNGVFVLNDDGSAATQTTSKTSYGWNTKFKPTSAQAEVSNSLALGQSLLCGQLLLSTNGQHYLKLEANGNLALFRTYFERSRWDSKKTTAPATGVASFALMSNGAPVVYGSDKKIPIWKGNVTGGDVKDPVLTVENDGDITVKSWGKQVWNSGTVAQKILS